MDERDDVSWNLSTRAGAVADRVATLLEQTCTVESGAPQAVAFLRSWADSVAGSTAVVTADRPTPLDALAARLSLTDSELDLVLLAGLPEEHEGLAGTFRALNPRGDPRPTAGLAALLLDLGRAAVRRLLVEGAAVAHGVLNAAGDAPFFERPLVLADALWAALHGHDAWPNGLERVEVPAPPAGLDAWTDSERVRRATCVLRTDQPCTVRIVAPDETAVLARCAALGAAAGRPLVTARLDPEHTERVRLLAMHAAARAAVPAMIPSPVDGAAPAPVDLARLPGPAVLCAVPGAARLAGCRPVITVGPGPVEPLAAWRSDVPELAGQAAVLAARHPLDPSVVAQIGADLRAGRSPYAGFDARDVAAAVRDRGEATLPPGAVLFHPDAGWERLILPVESEQALRDAVSRLGYQSRVLDEWGLATSARAHRGIRLLFTGPPGTGKSFAAEVLAAAAGTDLLVADLSHVVSKWVGETEKNLAVLFEVAESTGAVLLLDEADALFGARTEVGDAHDRYANLQTAYLLQRLDSFHGLVALATNLRQNVDVAFLRRMDFVVDFPVPEQDGRRALWDLHLPPERRAGDVELDVLARLHPVPGGWIRNAAVAAAFLAAPRADMVSQAELVAALRREYAKARRPFPGEPLAPRPAAGASTNGSATG